ncbi:tyrosine-protein kinase Srms isoform X5 [Erinaceus europaeus]|uniref:Tyrosine-protein kinase n=1 Tax=Erinaceus europaeus TaxID=9365 RepID=A0ABM3VTG6_ERIEU|nr:tyrosine-protein kinase Srms isoform X5 [Erinaceus europaeus]
MEPFLRKRLAFLSFFWNKIWPAGVADPVSDRELEPRGAEFPAEPGSPPAPARLFRALSDFRARCAGELSVSRGDWLFALQEDGEYLFARRLSSPLCTGLVPITCVAKTSPEPLSDQPWYFGDISRTQAQQLLLSAANAPGAFLVRPSESRRGDYSLSADMKLDDLAQEIRTLKSLRHERLIRLHAVCSTGEPVYIVTELMRKGSLQAYLGGPEGRTLSLPLLLSFACQVAEGMGYLEGRRIVHRDLAARNVLVGDNLACKVADFGLARLLKDDVYSPSSSSKIPVKWTAPEAANYCIFSQKSNVWSFGVFLYEVFTYGQCPYEGGPHGRERGMSNHETLQQVMQGYRLPRPPTCPAEVYVLMLECWKGSPEERPAFSVLQEKLGDISRCFYPTCT